MLIKIGSEIPKFKCNACGSCCSRIRGLIPEDDRKFIKEFAYGKMPVVQLVPVEKMTFPLWDWEAKRFNEWQKEANVNANIKPLRAIYDLNSKKAIILTYFMDSNTNACPFLKQNKCSIYHTKRAYVCRLFPFNRGPFIQYAEMKLKEGLFGDCGAMEHILPQVPGDFNKMIKFLYEAFPDGSFINAVQNDMVIEWANKTTIDLIRRKILKPAINWPYDSLMRKIESSEKIDFSDFLVESGFVDDAEMQRLISSFDGNNEAKKIIERHLQ